MMAATFRGHSEPYRESVRSAQTTSVYSTDSSSYLDGSPLDSIIRDYPVVPGASPNAFKFSPAPYTPASTVSGTSATKIHQVQQQSRGLDAPSRLRELQSDYVGDDAPTPRHGDFQNLVPAGHSSSPLLHTQFRSPTDTVSADSFVRPRIDGQPNSDQQSFIDLRESGVYTQSESSYGHNRSSSYSNTFPYGRSGHGVPPRFNHGVDARGSKPISYAALSQGHFSPPKVTKTISEESSELPYNQPAQARETFLSVDSQKDDPGRNSWNTEASEDAGVRQTWMTGTSVADPFSFRHFETPYVPPGAKESINEERTVPKVITHPPMSDNTQGFVGNGYQDNYFAMGEARVPPEDEEENDPYAYIPPTPQAAPVQGRMPSKVPIANRYNFSRPMRSDYGKESTEPLHSTANPSNPPSSFAMPASVSQNMEGQDPHNSYAQLPRKAVARMSIPKTVPNLVFTDDQLSPSPKPKAHLELSPPDSTPGSPGNTMFDPSNLGVQGLARDQSRSPSPRGSPNASPRQHASSPLPGPPKTYEVPYSYRVTITDRQIELPSKSDAYAYSFQPEQPSSSNQTRYSHGGTVYPPAPRQVVALPSNPPNAMARPGSNLSLYSSYSFYDLPESGAATPIAWDKNRSGENRSGENSPSRGRTPTPTNGGLKANGDYQSGAYLTPQNETRATGGPISAQECLLLGISHHENDRLEESAYWFEKAANENGGCGVGMLMWGLSLRHAWGVEKDERAAFWWLRRAAECAVEDLEKANNPGTAAGESGERDRRAVQSELVLAIYEVGQCFFHGWGVETDKKMAVSYFQVAARLGDVDAQLELGFCFANGKGCKKDLKEAAKWYRAAAAQGASTVGLAWIYKSKYGGSGDDSKMQSINEESARSLLTPSKPGSVSGRSSSGGRSDHSPRKLKKPNPRSKTPNSSRARSPARTENSTSMGTIRSS